MNIFSVKPGVAVAIKDPDTPPMVMDFDGWGGFDTRYCLLQGISASSQGNYQFLHTLRGFVYVYVFGERIGECTITGLTMAGKCPGGQDGITELVNYYKQNAISVTGKPVGIQIAGSGFQGFLTGINVNANNPKGRMGQFALQFRLLPPESE